jgi:acyl-CoA synthetase (NDP forming)
MAGSDRMYDAFLRQLGVIRVQHFSDLLDVPAALATGRHLRGNRVAILTSTGGAGTLVSDELGLAGFETPAPDAQTAAALRALHTGSEAVLDRNPIDVTLAGLRPDLLRGAIKALLASPTYDALTIIVGSSGLAQPELMAGALQDCLPDSDKPVFASVSPHAPEVARLLMQRGVPAYFAAESCAAGYDALRRVKEFSAPVAQAVQVNPQPALAQPAGSLDEAQAKQWFAQHGIPGVTECVVTRPEEAVGVARSMGERVVLKMLSSQITHKSEVGGVAVGVVPQELPQRMQRMADAVQAATGSRPERFLLQSMVTGGVELILGLHRDALGTAVLLGMGGVTAELFQDTCLRMLPPQGGLSHEEALSMARELRTWPLLDGYRGRPRADVPALVEAIVAFSRMAAQWGDRLVEAEINPLFVLPHGQGVLAADGVVVLA